MFKENKSYSALFLTKIVSKAHQSHGHSKGTNFFYPGGQWWQINLFGVFFEKLVGR